MAGEAGHRGPVGLQIHRGAALRWRMLNRRAYDSEITTGCQHSCPSAVGLLTALYFWNGSFGPLAIASSQPSGYGSTGVETRPPGDACRLEARTRGSTWATGASSASGARDRTARRCASSARGQISLVTVTAVMTIWPGEFSSSSFTSADEGATDGNSLSPRGHLSHRLEDRECNRVSLTPDQWHASPNQAHGTSLPAARRSACSAPSMCR